MASQSLPARLCHSCGGRNPGGVGIARAGRTKMPEAKTGSVLPLLLLRTRASPGPTPPSAWSPAAPPRAQGCGCTGHTAAARHLFQIGHCFFSPMNRDGPCLGARGQPLAGSLQLSLPDSCGDEDVHFPLRGPTAESKSTRPRPSSIFYAVIYRPRRQLAPVPEFLPGAYFTVKARADALFCSLPSVKPKGWIATCT
jgi:hypothetical protein